MPPSPPHPVRPFFFAFPFRCPRAWDRLRDGDMRVERYDVQLFNIFRMTMHGKDWSTENESHSL